VGIPIFIGFSEANVAFFNLHSKKVGDDFSVDANFCGDPSDPINKKRCFSGEEDDERNHQCRNRDVRRSPRACRRCSPS
jgi:hypothetical protein